MDEKNRFQPYTLITDTGEQNRNRLKVLGLKKDRAGENCVSMQLTDTSSEVADVTWNFISISHKLMHRWVFGTFMVA